VLNNALSAAASPPDVHQEKTSSFLALSAKAANGINRASAVASFVKGRHLFIFILGVLLLGDGLFQTDEEAAFCSSLSKAARKK
jgi:hypothetical protein